MNQPVTRQQLINEIELIPESRLQELFDFLHYFRLGLQVAHQQETEAIASPAPTTSVLASLAGSWEGNLVREPQGNYEQRLELE